MLFCDRTIQIVKVAVVHQNVIELAGVERLFAGHADIAVHLGGVGGGAADRLLASVGRPDLFMEMCVSYLAASEMLSIVENLNDAGVGVLSGLVRKMKRK